jgi:hypothetical protein
MLPAMQSGGTPHTRARVRSPVYVPEICPSGLLRTCVREGAKSGNTEDCPRVRARGLLSMTGAWWLHRGSKITFVPRGHVSKEKKFEITRIFRETIPAKK